MKYRFMTLKRSVYFLYVSIFKTGLPFSVTGFSGNLLQYFVIKRCFFRKPLDFDHGLNV